MHLFDKLCDTLATPPALDEIDYLYAVPELAELPTTSAQWLPLFRSGTKLGLPFDNLDVLLSEAHARFHSLRGLTDPDSLQQFEIVTRISVLLKPDNYTAMNARKQLVLSNQVSVDDELSLVELVFSLKRNTKSSIAWHHRRWLLSLPDVKKDLDHELNVCKRATTVYPKNYYAWSYRHWLLSDLAADDRRMRQEYETMKTWVASNVSDHSGTHHLEYVLSRLQWWDWSHLDWLDTLILNFPGHETLWSHRRFCIVFALHQSPLQDDFYETQHNFLLQIIDHQPTPIPQDSSTKMQVELALRFGVWMNFQELRQKRPMQRAAFYLERLPQSFLATATVREVLDKEPAA